jgi:transcriptional regulator GlxA family with amidase domain
VIGEGGSCCVVSASRCFFFADNSDSLHAMLFVRGASVHFSALSTNEPRERKSHRRTLRSPASVACHPLAKAGRLATGEKPPRKLMKWRLLRALRYVDEHVGETISLQDLASEVGISRMYFAAQFRAATGMRPHDFIQRFRVLRAQSLLKESDHSISAIAGLVGFQTQAHFTFVFKRIIGLPPARWRDGLAARRGGSLAVGRVTPTKT